MQGQGTLLFEIEGKTCYSSSGFEKSKRDGYGFEVCTPNKNFTGKWDIAQAHAFGTGHGYDYQEGFMKNGRFSGETVLKYADGRTILGMFVGGAMTGPAYSKERDGREFLINFKRGHVSGRVLMRDPVKKSVEEFFMQDGKQLGKSILLFGNTEIDDHKANFSFKPRKLKI